MAGICLRDGFDPWAVGVCLDVSEGLTPSVVLLVPKVIEQSDSNSNVKMGWYDKNFLYGLFVFII